MSLKYIEALLNCKNDITNIKACHNHFFHISLWNTNYDIKQMLSDLFEKTGKIISSFYGVYI